MYSLDSLATNPIKFIVSLNSSPLTFKSNGLPHASDEDKLVSINHGLHCLSSMMSYPYISKQECLYTHCSFHWFITWCSVAMIDLIMMSSICCSSLFTLCLCSCKYSKSAVYDHLWPALSSSSSSFSSKFVLCLLIL